MEQRDFLLDRVELRNVVQRVLAYDKLGPSRRTIKRFTLIANDGKDGSMLRVGSLLLLLGLSSPTDSGEKDYVFLQYMR